MIAKFLDFITQKGASDIRRYENTLSFVFNNHYYLFSYDEIADANYIRLLLPDVETSTTIDADIRKTMIEISTEYKVIKAIELDNKVWLSTEVFVYSTNNIEQLFQRIIELMESVLEIYHGKRKEQTANA